MQNLGEVLQEYPVAKIRFHPKNQQLLTIAAEVDLVILWGWNLRGEIRQLSVVGTGETHPYTDAVYHPNGKWLLLAGSGRYLEVRNIQDGELIGYLGQTGPEVPGYDNLAMSSSDKVIVASSLQAQTVDLYDLELGAVTPGGWKHRAFGASTLHPEGTILAINALGEENEVLFATLSEQGLSPVQRSLPLGEAASGLMFSPNGKLLASLSGDDDLTVAVYKFPSLEPVFKLTIERDQDLAQGAVYPAERAVFSPDSRHLICPSPNGHLIELDTASGKELNRWHPHRMSVTSLDVHYRRGLLVSASYDGLIKIWKFPYEGKLPSIRGTQVTRSFHALLEEELEKNLDAVCR